MCIAKFGNCRETLENVCIAETVDGPEKHMQIYMGHAQRKTLHESGTIYFFPQGLLTGLFNYGRLLP